MNIATYHCPEITSPMIEIDAAIVRTGWLCASVALVSRVAFTGVRYIVTGAVAGAVIRAVRYHVGGIRAV